MTRSGECGVKGEGVEGGGMWPKYIVYLEGIVSMRPITVNNEYMPI